MGACLLSGEHIIPNGGQTGLKFPHTLTLHRCVENFNQNHFQFGLTLSRSTPPQTAGVLPLSLNKGRMSSIFRGGGGGVSDGTEI